MASSSDIRDILNLGAGPRGPAPKKKKKRVEPVLPRMTGVSREVQALMGDSVPPIAIVEHKAYKSKPSISQKLFKVRHWEERPFVHGAREDGLVLKHWKRSIPRPTRPPVPSTAPATAPSDTEMTDGVCEPAQQHPPDTAAAGHVQFEDEFPSSKWNVRVPIDRYTDQQYEDNFKSDDWSREETDYLMQLCVDFDLRWIIIADRYTPTEIPGTEQRQYADRTMEQLKSRYYSIAARLMEMRTPASNMTSTEFQLWEKMRNFDAKTEKVRKEMADKLFERTKDEAEEERILLEELHRITKNEEDFIKLRRDLYSRLESVQPIRRTDRGEEQSTAMYQTSAGLSMLLQSLLAKERKLKRPQPAAGGSATPAEPKRTQPNQYTRRETLDSNADDSSSKKGSAAAAQPTVRTLTAAEEAKYGVSHPKERLTSGVQFRHEKINRLTMAKSQVQTSKMQAALAELGIPPRLLMPTEKVCREFERLVNNIHLLLDARKVSDKVKAEIQVLQEARRIRLGLPKDADTTAAASATADAAAAAAAAAGASGQPTKTDAGTSQVVQVKAEEDDAGRKVDTKEEETREKDKQNAEAGADEGAAADTADKAEGANDDSRVDEDDEARTTGQTSVRGDEDEEADGEDEDDDDDDDDDNAADTTLGQEDEDDDEDGEEVDESGVEAAEASDAADSDNDNEEGSEAAPDADADADSDNEAEADDDEEEEEEEDDDNDEEEEEDEDEDEDEASRPSSPNSAAAAPPAVATASSHSSATRGRKRSASVLSASSKAGSSRSALARKRRK